jgi:hypothetical protein
MSGSEMEGRHHRPWSQRSAGAKALIITGIVIGVPALFTLCGAVTMWLWNALMPAIFKLPAIGFWQAIGILILTQLLFKGGRPGRMGRGRWKRHQVWKHMQEDEAAEKS